MATLYTTYQAQVNARDVSDVVTNVSPKDSPFFSLLQSNQGVARVKENVTASLAAANEGNAIIEGATLTIDDIITRGTESNVMQIFTKGIDVSGTQEVVIKHGGIRSEIDFQIKQRFTELATDVEKAFIQGVSASGSDAAARKLSGLIEKITTNTSTAATNNALWTGTSDANYAAFEDKLNDLFQTMFETGQVADTVFVGANRKRRISKLTTKVTRNIDAGAKKQILAVNVYEGDFGEVNIILNRYVPDVNILAIKLDMFQVSYLRRFKSVPLAKTTDSTRISIIGELTLDCRTEKAGGKITAS